MACSNCGNRYTLLDVAREGATGQLKLAPRAVREARMVACRRCEHCRRIMGLEMCDACNCPVLHLTLYTKTACHHGHWRSHKEKP